jgi:hypothetical protein
MLESSFAGLVVPGSTKRLIILSAVRFTSSIFTTIQFQAAVQGCEFECWSGFHAAYNMGFAKPASFTAKSYLRQTASQSPFRWPQLNNH